MELARCPLVEVRTQLAKLCQDHHCVCVCVYVCVCACVCACSIGTFLEGFYFLSRVGNLLVGRCKPCI